MKRLFQLLLTSSIVFILLEVGLRWMGFQPFTLPDYSFVSKPKSCFEPRNNIGVTLVPGDFTVTINEGLQFEVTHTSDSLRSTGSSLTKTKATVQFHGCSFTYGTGVNDEDSYPYLLNQKFPELSIQNCAVPGYAQIQLLNKLKNKPENFTKTDYIVLNYLSFHDERNALNTNYQEKLSIGYQLTKLKQPSFSDEFTFPYAELQGNQLILKQKHIQQIYTNTFWRSHSALLNGAFKLYQDSKVSEKEDAEVTRAIFTNIEKLCSENSIQLIVTFMDNKKRSLELKKYCESLGIKTVDLSVDWEDLRFTNHPYDLHPNSIAHQIFTDKLSDVMHQISLKNDPKIADDIITFDSQ